MMKDPATTEQQSTMKVDMTVTTPNPATALDMAMKNPMTMADRSQMDTTLMNCMKEDLLTVEAATTMEDQTMTDPMRIDWSTTIRTMMDQTMNEVWMSTDPATI
jgi:hypothetical protein